MKLDKKTRKTMIDTLQSQIESWSQAYVQHSVNIKKLQAQGFADESDEIQTEAKAMVTIEASVEANKAEIASLKADETANKEFIVESSVEIVPDPEPELEEETEPAA